MANPCKYTIKGIDTPLDYDQVRAYMLENYESLKPTEDAVQEQGAGRQIPSAREAGQNIPEGGQGVRPSEQGKETAKQGEEATLEQQVENFGVAPKMVKPVSTVINKVFGALKKAGLTTAKTVGDWIGIGKGEEKSYSLKINGKDVQVKNVSPEVVNGFYSNTEKALGEVKQDKMSGNQWATQLLSRGANKEEMQITGLEGFLKENAAKSISKTDIQAYLKENRIQIVEVVKGDRTTTLTKEDFKPTDNEVGIVSQGNGYTIEKSDNLNRSNPFDLYYEGEYIQENKSIDDAIDRAIRDSRNRKATADSGVKFQQYQLEGEKENYKEVLVLLPFKNRLFTERDELSKKQREAFNSGNYELANKIDNEISGITKKLKEQNAFGTEKEFKSTHFDEPNILVHLRMNTRTAADGSKVLFLEEVQSDWGQKGKKEGFRQELKQPKNYNELEVGDDIKGWGKIQTINEVDGVKYYNVGGVEITEEDFDFSKVKERTSEFKTPTAPFVMDTNAWTKLGLKFALKEAVAQGADKIAWATGEQQNERYDLSKQVDELNYFKNEDGTYTIKAYKKSSKVVDKKNVNEKELEGMVGKDVAEKIINDKGEPYYDSIGEVPADIEKVEGEGTLSGEGLKVGGKGMKGFYGSPTEGSLGIVGNVAKSLFKQVPGTVEIGGNKTQGQYAIKENEEIIGRYKTQDKANSALSDYQRKGYNFKVEKIDLDNASTQNSINITPELRASVEGGQPLFKQAESKTDFGGFQTRDGKPIGFKYDTDQVARERFDFSKLKKIGSGSDRDVYDLGNGRVVKVAKTARGLTQNIYEGDYYLKGIIPEVFERGLNYVVAESTPRIKTSDVVEIFDVDGNSIGTATAGEMLKELQRFSQKDMDNQDSKLQDVLAKYGLQDVMSYNVLWGDFIAQRNWGYKDGVAYHSDGGTFGGVDMITSFKGKTNLSDPDFRKIYEESKRLKKQFGDTDKATMYKGQGEEVQAQYRIESGKNTVEAIKDFDGSPEAVVALTHEIMHPTVVAIIDGAKDGNEVGANHTKTIVSEFNKATGQNLTAEQLIEGNEAFKEGTTTKQYRDVQEFIAESWEKYHLEGAKGFSKAFQEVLQQITEAFKAVYGALTGGQVTPELRQMFDEILGKETTTSLTQQTTTQDEKTEKRPMLEGLQATRNEGKGRQASPELRTEAKGEKEIEELAEPILIYKGNTGKLNPDGSRRTAHPNIKGVFGSTDLKSAERYGNDISKFDIPKGTTVETVEIKNKKIPLSEARKQETELVNASEAQIVRLITYDAKGKEVQYVIKDKSILQQNKPVKTETATSSFEDIAAQLAEEGKKVTDLNAQAEAVKQRFKETLAKRKALGTKSGIIADNGREKGYLDRMLLNDAIEMAKIYVQLGIKNVQAFAKEIGEKVDQILTDAWNVANGAPIPDTYMSDKEMAAYELGQQAFTGETGISMTAKKLAEGLKIQGKEKQSEQVLKEGIYNKVGQKLSANSARDIINLLGYNDAVTLIGQGYFQQNVETEILKQGYTQSVKDSGEFSKESKRRFEIKRRYLEGLAKGLSQAGYLDTLTETEVLGRYVDNDFTVPNEKAMGNDASNPTTDMSKIAQVGQGTGAARTEAATVATNAMTGGGTITDETELAETLSKAIKGTSKQNIADRIRKGKFGNRPQNNSLTLVKAAVDESLEQIATDVENDVDLKVAIGTGINKLKQHPQFTKLTPKQQEKVEKDFRKYLGEDILKGKPTKEGKSIFDAISTVVQGGFTKLSNLSNPKVKSALDVLLSFGAKLDANSKSALAQLMANVANEGVLAVESTKESVRAQVLNNLKDINGRLKQPMSAAELERAADAFVTVYESVAQKKIEGLIKSAYKESKVSISGSKNPQVAKEILYGALDDVTLRDKFAAKYGLPVITPAVQAKLTQLATNIAKAPSGAQKITAKNAMKAYITTLQNNASNNPFVRFKQATNWLGSMVFNNVLFTANGLDKAFVGNILGTARTAVLSPRATFNAFFNKNSNGNNEIEFEFEGEKRKVKFSYTDAAYSALRGNSKLTDLQREGIAGYEQRIRDQESKLKRRFLRTFTTSASRTYALVDSLVTPIASAINERQVWEQVIKDAYKNNGLPAPSRQQLTNDVNSIVNPSDTTVENAAAQAMSEIKGGALWQQLGFSPTDAFPTDTRSFKTAEGLTSKESKIYNEFMVRTYEILAEGRVERLQQLEANNSFTYLSDYTQTVSDVNDYVARTTNNITFFSRPPGTAGDLADALSWPFRRIPLLQYSGLWPMFANATARTLNLIYQGTPVINLAQPLVYKVTGTRGVLGSKIKGEKEFETKAVVRLDQNNMFKSAIGVNLIVAGVLGYLFSQYDDPEDEKEAIMKGKWNGIAPVTLTPAQRDVFGNRMLEGWVYRNGNPVFKYIDTPFAGVFAGIAYIKNNSGLFGDAVLEQADRSQNLFAENQPETMAALGGIITNMTNMMFNSSSIRGLTEIVMDAFGDRGAVAEDDASVASKTAKVLERVAANSIKNVIIPFHGASKEINNVIESFNGMNKKKATDFVEQMMMNELVWDGMIKSDMTDSWGRPVPERIKSMSPALGFNVFEVVGGKIEFMLDKEYRGDDYMALHIMHNYAPRTDNNLNFPVDITPETYFEASGSGSGVVRSSDISSLDLLDYYNKLKANKEDNITVGKPETIPLSNEIKKIPYTVHLSASESQKVNKQRGEIMKSVVDYGDNMDKLKVLNNQDYRNFMNSAYSLTKKIAVVNQHPDLVGAAYKISIQSAIDKLESTYNIAFPDELKQ